MPDDGALGQGMLSDIRTEPDALARAATRESAVAPEVVRLLARPSGTVYALGNGTSFHAAMFLAVLLNRQGRACIPIRASEASRWLPRLPPGSIAIVFSQSGASVDAIEALRHVQRAGGRVVGVTNEASSELAQLADIAVATGVGHELAVAATKTHLAQLVTALELTAADGRARLRSALSDASDACRRVLVDLTPVLRVTSSAPPQSVFLGSGLLYPIALEAALKMTETCARVSLAYPTREFLHGPRQVLDSSWSVYLLTENSQVAGELRPDAGNLMELTRWGSETYGIRSQEEVAASLTSLVIVQVLAYVTSTQLGLDPDQPSRLTKVIT
jgi:glutamine---fructose-6-phosphate transaminase (isomerizing)